MTTAHLLHNLLPPQSARLGRLTTNAHLPHQHYIDPLIPRPTDPEILTAHHSDFSETRTFTRRSHLRLTIALPLSLTFATTSSNTATLTAPQTTTRDLPNSDTWFTEACTQPATRRWLESAARSGHSVYLVVGVRSAHNARLDSNSTRSGDIGAQAVVPTVACVAPGVHGGGGGDGGAAVKMVAEGEQVFAVLYRKVRLRQMFTRSADAMALEGGCRWREVWDWEESRVKKARAPVVHRMVPVRNRMQLSLEVTPVVQRTPSPEPAEPWVVEREDRLEITPAVVKPPSPEPPQRLMVEREYRREITPVVLKPPSPEPPRPPLDPEYKRLLEETTHWEVEEMTIPPRPTSPSPVSTITKSLPSPPTTVVEIQPIFERRQRFARFEPPAAEDAAPAPVSKPPSPEPPRPPLDPEYKRLLEETTHWEVEEVTIPPRSTSPSPVSTITKSLPSPPTTVVEIQPIFERRQRIVHLEPPAAEDAAPVFPKPVFPKPVSAPPEVAEEEEVRRRPRETKKVPVWEAALENDAWDLEDDDDETEEEEDEWEDEEDEDWKEDEWEDEKVRRGMSGGTKRMRSGRRMSGGTRRMRIGRRRVGRSRMCWVGGGSVLELGCN